MMCTVYFIPICCLCQVTKSEWQDRKPLRLPATAQGQHGPQGMGVQHRYMFERFAPKTTNLLINMYKYHEICILYICIFLCAVT